MLPSVAALTAAACWTVASLLWRRLPTSLSASQLNLIKNLLALLLQLPLLAWLAPSIPASLSRESAGCLALLALSGVVGISLGDSFHFAALRRLGTRRSLTLEAGGPALTTLVGVVVLGEVPRLGQWLGIALISLAVLLVARQRPPAGGVRTHDDDEAGGRGSAGLPSASQTDGSAPAMGGPAAAADRWGLVFALGALICGSAGALLSRAALVGGTVTPLQAATVRLAVASLVMLPLLRTMPLLGGWRRARRRPWPLILIATLLGTNLGIVLQQTALAGLPGGLAVALLATAPLMGVLTAQLEGDAPGWPGLLAAIAGVAGVSLVVGLPLPGGG